MGLEDIPPHFLIMHQFLYQAEYPLKGGGETGPVGHTGKTREVAAKLRELGWRRADYNRESLDSEGNPVIRKQINRDSFWYRPEHWKKDEDVFPPVEPVTDEATEFMRQIRRGRRTQFPQASKESIMDALVQYMSGGRVSQWYGGAGGHERMKNRIGRIDRPAAVSLDVPEGVDDVMLIPRAAFLSVASRQVGGPDHAERGMGRFGWRRAMAGNREREVWYNPKHWDEAVGGELGLLPITDEAERYQAQLDPNRVGSPTRRYLPDISLLADVETLVNAAMKVGAAAPGGPGGSARGPGRTFRMGVSGEKEWQDAPPLVGPDDETPKRGARELPGQPPKQRAGQERKPPPPRVKHDPDADHPPIPKSRPQPPVPKMGWDGDDEDEDDPDDGEEDDIEGMSAAELDRRAAERWAKEKERMSGGRRTSSGKPSAEKGPEAPARPVLFADEDDD